MAASRLFGTIKDWMNQPALGKKSGLKNTHLLSIESLEDRTVPTAATMLDLGFEQVALSSGSFAYTPTGSSWTFNGTSGLTTNASGFTSSNATAPEGSQAAFLQNTGSFSQVAVMATGTYQLSFSAAQRANLPSSETFQVQVDGVIVGNFNNVTGAAYTTLTTSSFTVAGGNHTITFIGTNKKSGDNTVFIDQVAITQLPYGLSDSSFEQLALDSGSFSYRPTGTPWVFTGTSGLSTNGSAFTVGNSNTSQGSQVAFIQNTGSISQTVTLAAGTYSLNFTAAQRANLPSAASFQVLVDGTVVGTFNNLSSTSYSQLATSTFTVADGDHIITIMGTNLNGGDNTVFLDQVALSQQNGGLSDSGFESAVLSVGSYTYAPTGTSWVFTGTSGVSSSASAFTAGSAAAPEGGQVAFLQNTGSFSQSVNFTAGTYVLSFSAAQRANVASNQTFQVLVDGTLVGTFNNVTGSEYTQQSTSSFTVTAGNHTVTFVGTNLNGGDNTVLVDQVAVTQQTGGLADSGFEQQTTGAKGFSYNPTGSVWTFNGTSGVTANNSVFTRGNENTAQGSQVAFLQNNGSISQTVSLATGTYVLEFTAAQRANFGGNQTFQVKVDGVIVGSFNSITGSSYSLQSTSSFTVGYGSHIITFQGTNLNGGDNTIFLDQVFVTQQASNLSDSGFEQLALASGSFSYIPSGSAWQFVGTSGVASNASGFTAGNANSPQGSQVAFLQNTGSISQTVAMVQGTYQLTFSAAQRSNVTSAETFQVIVDGAVVGTFNTLSGGGYSQLTTSNFTVLGGTHTISFVGTNLKGGDNTVFLDQVSASRVG